MQGIRWGFCFYLSKCSSYFVLIAFRTILSFAFFLKGFDPPFCTLRPIWVTAFLLPALFSFVLSTSSIPIRMKAFKLRYMAPVLQSGLRDSFVIVPNDNNSFCCWCKGITVPKLSYFVRIVKGMCLFVTDLWMSFQHWDSERERYREKTREKWWRVF